MDKRKDPSIWWKKPHRILERGKLLDWKKDSKFSSKPAATKCYHHNLEEERVGVDAGITAESRKH